MPELTPEHKLIKPLASEPYDITQHNQNADIIDLELSKRLLADDYNAADVLDKLKTVDGAGSGLDAEFLAGKASSEYATAAQGLLVDGLLSGEEAAFNSLRLGNVDALDYAEKVYLREYVGRRGGDSAIFNEIAHPDFAEGMYWQLDRVDYHAGATIQVLNEAAGEVLVPVYFNTATYGSPLLTIGVVDQEVKAGDSIYVSLEAKLKEGEVSNSRLLFGSNQTELIEDMQLTDTYQKFDFIFKVTNSQLDYGDGLVAFEIALHPASALGYGYVELHLKSPIAINLTRSYGSFEPTAAQMRAKLFAFDNSFFWASAPVYTLVKDLKDRMDSVEANISLLTDSVFTRTQVTWASDDRVWHQKPSGFYELANAQWDAWGYPANYIVILHLAWHTTSDFAWGYSAMYRRRYNTTQDMGWKTP